VLKFYVSKCSVQVVREVSPYECDRVSGIKWGQILDAGSCWPGSLISTDARNPHNSSSKESAQWRTLYGTMLINDTSRHADTCVDSAPSADLYFRDSGWSTISRVSARGVRIMKISTRCWAAISFKPQRFLCFVLKNSLIIGHPKTEPF